jgi:hypothetical protein
VCECSVGCLSGVFCIQNARQLHFRLGLLMCLGWLYQSSTLSLLLVSELV